METEYIEAMDNQAPREEIKLSPFEYTKQTSEEGSMNILWSTVLIVMYMFISGIVGNFIELGGVWWVLVLSYILAIVGGVMFCISKVLMNEELVKLYKEEYYD
tara:strand:- start:2280 stop:2588 length:309 start_codon:yes stop_codon:yes gene_type:complete